MKVSLLLPLTTTITTTISTITTTTTIITTTTIDDQLRTLKKSGYNYAMISAVLDRASSSCRYRYKKLEKGDTN
jgi:hypothetical protein